MVPSTGSIPSFDPSFVTTSVDASKTTSVSKALTALKPSDYEKIGKAYKKSISLPPEKRIEAFTSLLCMNVEQLPTIHEPQSPTIVEGRLADFFLNQFHQTYVKMIDYGYGAFKEKAYDEAGNPFLHAILIEVNQNVGHYHLRLGDGFIDKVTLSDGHLKIEHIDENSTIGKILFETSPAVKSAELHRTLDLYSKLPRPVIRIVDDYAGFPREGLYENFADFKQHFPKELASVQSVGRFKKIKENITNAFYHITGKSQPFKQNVQPDLTPFQYVGQFKQTINENIKNLFRVILGYSYGAEITLDWYTMARPTLQKILSSRSYNPDERNYTEAEKAKIRSIMKVGDAINLRPDSFKDEETMLLYLSHITDEFRKYVFPDIAEPDPFVVEIVDLARKDNPKINSVREIRAINEAWRGMYPSLDKISEIIQQYISLI